MLKAALRVYRGVRQTRVETWLALQRRQTDFKNRRAVTAPNIARRNSRRAYERIYGDQRLLNEYLGPERLLFYAEVAETAAREHPRSVVDVGCGAGELLRAVVERGAPERVVGIDYAAAGIRRASALVPSGEFYARSLYDLNLTETFELVLCTEVLEHVRAPEDAADVLVRLCASPGTIVITVPDGAQDAWQGHLNFWTEAALEDFLGRYGNAEVSRMRTDAASLLAVVRR